MRTDICRQHVLPASGRLRLSTAAARRGADLTSTVAKRIADQERNARASAVGGDGQGDWVARTLRAASQASVVIGSPLSTQHIFDLQLAVASELTSDLRATVKARLGYTVSAGISFNKLLAKLGSAMNKPDAQTTIALRAVPEVMKNMKASKIRGFGPKIVEPLELVLGCSTAGDVQALPSDTLRMYFGENAECGALYRCSDATPPELSLSVAVAAPSFARCSRAAANAKSCAGIARRMVARTARGMSDEPVEATSAAKSMMSAKAFTLTYNWSEMERYMRMLCSEHSSRLAEDSEESCRRRAPPRAVQHAMPSSHLRPRRAPMLASDRPRLLVQGGVLIHVAGVCALK